MKNNSTSHSRIVEIDHFFTPLCNWIWSVILLHESMEISLCVVNRHSTLAVIIPFSFSNTPSDVQNVHRKHTLIYIIPGYVIFPTFSLRNWNSYIDYEFFLLLFTAIDH